MRAGGPLSNKEITLLNLLLKLNTYFRRAKGKNNVLLQSIIPNIQKSKKNLTSQLPTQLVNNFIKTGFELSA